MAHITIKLDKNECVHEVKERLLKALQDDDVLESSEKYNDELMEDLAHQSEKMFSDVYFEMIKHIVSELKAGV